MNKPIEIKPQKMWWAGDNRVEAFMPPISAVLERHGISGDKKVAIYNRAYEAIYKAICLYSGKPSS